MKEVRITVVYELSIDDDPKSDTYFETEEELERDLRENWSWYVNDDTGEAYCEDVEIF